MKPTVRLELASNPSRAEAAGRRKQVKEGSFIHAAPTELADINSADVVFLICWKAFGKDIQRGGGDLSLCAFLFLLLRAVPSLLYLHRGLFTGYESFIIIFQQEVHACSRWLGAC